MEEGRQPVDKRRKASTNKYCQSALTGRRKRGQEIEGPNKRRGETCACKGSGKEVSKNRAGTRDETKRNRKNERSKREVKQEKNYGNEVQGRNRCA